MLETTQKYFKLVEIDQFSFKRNILKGHENPNSRFTESQVAEIKEMRLNGSIYRKIADKFNVSITAIHNVCKEISYK